MKIGKDHKVAVGRALRGVDPEDVREARLDGEPVDVKEAQVAAAELASAAADAPRTKLSDFEDKVEAGSDAMRARLEGSRAGRWAVAALSADPELVKHDAQLVVVSRAGERVELTIPVIHLKATAMLQKGSLASELGSLLPFGGLVVPIATSLASALGSVVARGMGNPEVADALTGTAKKHLVLAGVGWIPGVSGATSTLAAIEDRKNLKQLANPSVEAVVQLRPAPSAQGA